MSTALALLVGASLAAPMPSRADEPTSAAGQPAAHDVVPGVTAGGPVSRSVGTGRPEMVQYEDKGAEMAADGRLLLQLGMLIAALYVAFLFVWFSRTRRRSALGARRADHARQRVRASRAGTVANPGAFALLRAATQSVEPEKPSVPAGQNGYMPTERAASGRPEAPAAPPDPAAAWTGEIDWRKEDGTARFQLVAQRLDGGGETTVASPAFAWPPTTASSVEALTAAADQLETALLEAGWSPLGRGSAWYAHRFGWEPAGAARSAPALRAEPQASSWEVLGTGATAATTRRASPSPTRRA